MVFEFLSDQSVQYALISGIAIALFCSTVGLFLVLRKFALFGDALAHTAFGGVAFGLFIGVYPLWAAYIVSILGALGLTKLRQRFDISGDAAVAILLTSGIAVGIILFSITDVDDHQLDDEHDVKQLNGIQNIEESHDEESHDEESHDEESHDEESHDEESHDEESHDEHDMNDFRDMKHAHDMEEFLFGSILQIKQENVITILILCVIILIILRIIYKKLLYATFSEEQAKVSGIPVEKINYLLIGMSGVAAVTSMQLVGVLLVSALFVIPNVSAMLYGRSFKQTITLSTSFSLFSVVMGIIIAIPFGIEPSGCIVLLAIGILIVSLIIKSTGIVKTTGFSPKVA
ncbi:MAG: iron chelate uptake ABC transporter family permease subunit [Thaumarchaeota archaeon]|jgi:ABC-type Mn2+/Zn2+ transport system permease subunit|nr:iron chelate uptake ABC transporter family permease subunit [Nitrososphaerota archaeon]MBT4676039.1 iron chelate uptake ABC transporter family permease subunit [Nitrososphaerota archaeon]MBT6171568.1 iron chelate uptake ABC transporter family permease subunit [Nitrososphaerota archaeon]MBT7359768.1 iron chelate uptake ABC transporter family permease subunit [Nitrososphaerota archaeon]